MSLETPVFWCRGSVPWEFRDGSPCRFRRWDVGMLLVRAFAIAAPACLDAAPGECVEYRYFPGPYADAAAAEASCRSFGGARRVEGCPRDAASWLGEGRKSTWSKHYYASVAGEAAIGELCVSAEGGTWYPRGTAPPSDYDAQWARWKQLWGGGSWTRRGPTPRRCGRPAPTPRPWPRWRRSGEGAQARGRA